MHAKTLQVALKSHHGANNWQEPVPNTTLLEYLDVTKPSRCIATKCLLVVPRSSSCGCLFVTFIVIQVLISFLATVNSFASPQSILVMFHLVIPFGYPFGYLHVMLCPFVYLIH